MYRLPIVINDTHLQKTRTVCVLVRVIITRAGIAPAIVDIVAVIAVMFVVVVSIEGLGPVTLQVLMFVLPTVVSLHLLLLCPCVGR
jgi:hypothetical protein